MRIRRTSDDGFTLTELMVVVVILSLLAALSTPMFGRDNNARKGRDWAKTVAQLLQRARFQAMGDRADIHVLLYRTHVDMYRREPSDTVPPYTLLGSVSGPAVDADRTMAIWDARSDGAIPTAQSSTLAAAPALPASVTAPNDIVFTSLGSTANTTSWRVYLRNELLHSTHPDASFVINIGGLTGYISTNDKVVLP
jgi:prepilin-type N-terminal cleavage/methylation domain-containing protein